MTTCRRCNDHGFLLKRGPLSHIGIDTAVPCPDCEATTYFRRAAFARLCIIGIVVVCAAVWFLGRALG